MRYRSRKKCSVGLNLTPLIDIVFLLLVFFMLTAHFVQDQVVDVRLPEAASGQVLENEAALEVSIGADGGLRVAGQEVALEDLEAALRRDLHARTDKRVVLRGDQGTELGLTVKVMDAARLAGAESLDIVTEQP